MHSPGIQTSSHQGSQRQPPSHAPQLQERGTPRSQEHTAMHTTTYICNPVPAGHHASHSLNAIADMARRQGSPSRPACADQWPLMMKCTCSRVCACLRVCVCVHARFHAAALHHLPPPMPSLSPFPCCRQCPPPSFPTSSCGTLFTFASLASFAQDSPYACQGRGRVAPVQACVSPPLRCTLRAQRLWNVCRDLSGITGIAAIHHESSKCVPSDSCYACRV